MKVEGQSLPKGKYGLFSILDGDEWTIIFNKTWNQEGAFDYKQADDALRVKVKNKKAQAFAEKMKFTIAKSGKVSLTWGDKQFDVNVQ